jgi:rRNA maturation protein Nop10
MKKTTETINLSCPDCGVSVGERHNDWCDVEPCPDCGGQLISCDCEGDFKFPRLKWSGEWPGKMECREFGWYVKWLPGKGWVRCDKDDPEARENLNRLHEDATWDKHLGRYILEDICPKCGKEINLALPHDYDRALQKPVHREC